MFFVSEENGVIPNVGVDMLLKNGKLDKLKDGPVYWMDSADTDPCIGMSDYCYYVMCLLIHRNCFCSNVVNESERASLSLRASS